MENNNKKFPENASHIIKLLLEKYKLQTIKKLFEKYSESEMETPEQEEELENEWENLPGPRIAKTLKETAENKIKDKKTFIKELQERLNISQETAENLADDLEEKILIPAQISFGEKKISPSQKIAEGREETFSEKEPAAPETEDIYREPIE